MNKTKWVVLLLIAGFFLSGIPFTNAEPVQKKNRYWLIPVLAGAGFAAGTYVGLNAFDDSINSDQKVWTTAAIFSVAGGIAGWLIGRPKTEHIQSYGLPVHQFEIRRQEEINYNQSDLKIILSDMRPGTSDK